ncbi:LOW QUALITY PROTEIN: hypothetical protein HID58_086813 [Brassica napus]|uniref:Uncharacterized protein n=1 Tax=Brassica napus TaxID=3708 RepID=A0ABQ7XTC9_BRANA|nr:LOW QUALITY PROTEIN: hypothetical protein HID58_086813 [Brassica napus]
MIKQTQRINLQPSHALSQTLTEEPSFKPLQRQPIYIHPETFAESLGKVVRVRRPSICPLKRRQSISQNSTRVTLDPLAPTLPVNQRRVQTSTTSSCSKQRHLCGLPRNTDYRASLQCNKLHNRNMRKHRLDSELTKISSYPFMVYNYCRTTMFIVAATTKKARATTYIMRKD